MKDHIVQGLPAIPSSKAWFQKRHLIHTRDLLLELVARDMKLRYKRSVLGVVWSLLNPLFQLVILVFVFRRTLRLEIPNYAAFVFIGVLGYNWFQAALFQATSAVTGNRELVKQPGFPCAILPIVVVTTNLVHFVAAQPILLAFILLSGIRLTSAVLALPLVITLEFLLILGLAYLIATMQVWFRDTQHLLSVFLRLFFFLTPIFYSTSSIPASYQALYKLNPVAYILTAYRTILLEGSLPYWPMFLALGIGSGILVWLGYAVYVRASHQFAEEL